MHGREREVKDAFGPLLSNWTTTEKLRADVELAAADLRAVARIFLEAREPKCEEVVSDELAGMIDLPLIEESLPRLVHSLPKELLDLETVQAHAPARREPKLRLVDFLIGASHWESAVIAV